MKNCIDEGTLQAWFDGELAANEAGNVAAHLNTCPQCATAASAVETESVMLSETLATEFTAPVPTERLRQRVDLAVARLQHDKPAPKTSRRTVFAEFFSFQPLAYALAAMIVLVGIIGFVYLKNQKTMPVANNNQAPAMSPETAKESPQLVGQIPARPINSNSPKPAYVAVVRAPNRVKRTKPAELDATSLKWQEQQYENAIAKLNEALKIQPPMRPALQVEYEYNIAVIDNAIKTTRGAAKKNPNDPLANQSMLTAYQSKIDFMNEIADARALQR